MGVWRWMDGWMDGEWGNWVGLVGDWLGTRGVWLGCTYLGDCLVVDVDELPRVGVDLERAVEAQRCLDVVCACNERSVSLSR